MQHAQTADFGKHRHIIPAVGTVNVHAKQMCPCSRSVYPTFFSYFLSCTVTSPATKNHFHITTHLPPAPRHRLLLVINSERNSLSFLQQTHLYSFDSHNHTPHDYTNRDSPYCHSASTCFAGIFLLNNQQLSHRNSPIFQSQTQLYDLFMQAHATHLRNQALSPHRHRPEPPLFTKNGCFIAAIFYFRTSVTQSHRT